MQNKLYWRFLSVCSVVAVLATAVPALLAQDVDCSQMEALGIDKQTNLRAGMIRVACGLEPAGSPGPGSASIPDLLPGGDNVDVITGFDTFPHVTHSESMIATGDGQTIVVNYNDSRTAPSNGSGVSYSLDSGASWTRILPSPFAAGHGTNFGDPIVSWNAFLGEYFAGDLVAGCGFQGIGMWSSIDGINWNVEACAHIGFNDDRESMWVDNNLASPFYGRMYVSFNDFSVAGFNVYVTYSDDGVTWVAPRQITFNPSGLKYRNIQLTGAPDGSGAVFLAVMDENGGQFNNRRNLMYRSFDGGDTWPGVFMGGPFSPPGDALCSPTSYFARINPIWRHMGWGQPAAGPNGVVHYVYSGFGGGICFPPFFFCDRGEVYYQRSLDNGVTWSSPLLLSGSLLLNLRTNAWMPSLSVTAGGTVQAGWYDRHNSPNGLVYQYMGRQSLDNGATWQPLAPITNRLIVQPEQPDPNVQACYAGDYNYHMAFGNTNFMTWTDGRNYALDSSGNVHFEQDVFFGSVP